MTEDSPGAFAAQQGIKAGRFDRFLDQLAAAIRVRQGLLNHARPPKQTLDMLSNHQVWAWIDDKQGGQWEVRGTGAVVCTCLSPGDSYESYEGPQRDCPEHGEGPQ